MSRYFLVASARTDIREIRRFTTQRFGPEQATRVTQDLRSSFQHLAHHPLSAPERPDLDPPNGSYRYYAFKSFLIVCRPVNGGVRIFRIVHAARDLPTVLAKSSASE